ncbi:ATP-dependent zinc protease [Lishizhenia sp.]|uniref:ATP-dependent zinc protease family protein n=1 Tax=Lishizhenia sp. TaxID=2497594 RepID=UPI00299F3512|nr:RimK/LysX family protein [Lishizhenia sp.]MDX1445546.1 RimK/LysX family protein [Lishizhenia sp.]
MKKEKFIIGKSDKANFPDFNLKDVKVKIDTGAYTSTIHCSEIWEENNELKVIFLSDQHLQYTGEIITFKEYSLKKVRSSSGQSQLRYKVKGTITLFGKIFNTEFTLSRRDKMKYPVLLGRKLLNNNFLVDTSKKNLSHSQTH